LRFRRRSLTFVLGRRPCPRKSIRLSTGSAFPLPLPCLVGWHGDTPELLARPRFEPADVVFQEWFASGCSQKNIITKIGGARNCLRLVVTRSFLWVTSWFPFSLIAPFYDMEHVIPLNTIISVRSASFLGRRTFLLTYRDSTGGTHTLRLLPKKPDDFITQSRSKNTK